MSKPQPAKTDSRRAQLRAEQIAEAKRQKNRRIAMLAVGAVAVIAVLVVVVLLVNNFSQAKAEAAPPNANAQQNGIRVHPGNAKQGAPVVALFADYQCPACARFEQTYSSQLDKLVEVIHIEELADADGIRGRLWAINDNGPRPVGAMAAT